MRYLVMMSAGLLLSSCVQSIDRTADERAIELARWQERGLSFVANRDFSAAEEIYAQALDRFPEDPELALGAVFSDLMSIGEWAPVREFLARCNQSAELDPGDLVFGPDGLIAQSAWPPINGQGVQISYRNGPDAVELPVPFSEPRVRAVALPAEYPIRLESSILVTVRDFSSESGAWLIVSFDPDDLDAHDESITPISDGASVDVSSLNGFVTIYDPMVFRPFGESTAVSYALPSGMVRIVRAGTTAGEALELALDLEVPAWCQTAGCEAVYRVTGTIPTTLLEEINIDSAALPFGDLEEDLGPPRRDALVVAFDRCSPFDMSFVRAKVQAIGDRFRANAERLAPFVQLAAKKESFSWRLPESLFPRGAPLSLNATDALLLRGLLQLVASLTELAAQYDYADGIVQELLRLQDWWFSQSLGDGPAQAVSERVWGFEPSLVVANLSEAFLRKKDGASFDAASARFRDGLFGLALALRHAPGGPGIFDFQVAGSRGLSSDLADLLEAMAFSMDAESAEAVPHSPGYFIHLAAYFDEPWDRVELARRLDVPSLVRLAEGDPESSEASERNPQIVFEIESMAEGIEWMAGLWDEPEGGLVICQDALGCELGYSCLEGSCEPNPPWFLNSSAWNDVFAGAWPVFMSAESRVVLGPLLEGFVDGLYLSSR